MTEPTKRGFLGRWRFSQDPPDDRKPTDSYFEKLIKYIPADIVAAYVALDGILKENLYSPMWLGWSVFGALVALTPLYVCYMKTSPPGLVARKTFHWMASTFAFMVWVFALGGPFAATFDWYRPVFGTVLLIVTTLILPVFESIVYGSPPPTNGPPPTTGPTPPASPAPPAGPTPPASPPTPPTNPPV